MLSVAFDRSSLSLADLTIGDAPQASGLWLVELTRPGRRWRRTSAGSPWTHGSVLTRATLETAEIALALYAQAATSAALATLRTEVEDAAGQFFYTLGVDEDGVALTYECEPADLSWNEHDRGMAGAHLARAVLSIPCHPVSV